MELDVAVILARTAQPQDRLIEIAARAADIEFDVPSVVLTRCALEIGAAPTCGRRWKPRRPCRIGVRRPREMCGDHLKRGRRIRPLAVGIALCSRERQVVASARQPDEEEAFFLLVVIILRRRKKHSVRWRTGLAAPLQREDAFPEGWKMHGLELQPLTGVYGHEPYRVDSFDSRRWFAQSALIAEHLQPSDPAK